ncbi:MAG: hypothetical protein GY835_19955 [bacterium]|nr:hypothetical protein [bacterium]
MKKSFTYLLILVLAIPASLARSEEDQGFPTSTGSRDSLERAITILLPQIETKLEGSGEDVTTRDLYRTVSIARGYLELELFDEAGEWFLRLEELDTNNLFSDAIFNGRVAIAAGRGDIDSMQTLIRLKDENVENPDMDQIVAVYTEIGKSGKWELLEEVIANTLPFFGGKPPAMVLYLQGRAMRRQGKLPEAVFHFERMLNRMKIPESVNPDMIASKSMFIQAAADCSFLMNDRNRARRHYSTLIDSEHPEYRSWGVFHIAQLDMLENKYERAEAGFKLIAAEQTGMRIEGWAEQLAAHCAKMQKYARYYVNNGPRQAAAGRR